MLSMAYVVISDCAVVVSSTISLAVLESNCAELALERSNPAGNTTLTNKFPTYAPVYLKLSILKLPVPAKYLLVHDALKLRALSWVLARSTVPFPYS